MANPQTDRASLRVNGGCLWTRLMEMAEIGATPAGGVHRLTLTDEDRKARDLFLTRCRPATAMVSQVPGHP